MLVKTELPRVPQRVTYERTANITVMQVKRAQACLAAFSDASGSGDGVDSGWATSCQVIGLTAPVGIGAGALRSAQEPPGCAFVGRANFCSL